MEKSRLKNTIINAKVGLVFHLLSIVSAFASRGLVIAYLGSEFVGLTSTMLNIVGFFNLAEMGFSSVIAFALYQPLHNRDENSINEVLSLLKYVYQKIGYFILFIGILLSFFIPVFFKEIGLSIYTVLATYFTYLTTSLLGYFVNYNEALLAADQKNYVKVKLFNIIKIIRIIVQLFFLMYISKSVFAWLFLEFFFLTIYSFILNKKIKILYPSLVLNINDGRSLLKKYRFIYIKTKQAFFHRACGLILTQSSGILIYLFSNLETVTKYTNYTLITGSILTLINTLFDSTNAAVGNLVAEKNEETILKVFWELQVSRFWIASSIAYITYVTIDLFMSAWIGVQFVISADIKILLLIVMFIMIIRKTNDEFIGAYGLYSDVWAPIAEAAFNIVIAISIGYIIGIASIPLGVLVSLIAIVVIWKPIFLYKEFAVQKVGCYFLKIINYLGIAFLSLYIVHRIPIPYLDLDNQYVSLIYFAAQKSLITFFITGMLFYIATREMRTFIKRFVDILKKRSV